METYNSSTSLGRILLINPALPKEVTTKKVLRYDPPVGLLNLASFLHQKGYVCEFVDTAFNQIDWDKIII